MKRLIRNGMRHILYFIAFFCCLTTPALAAEVNQSTPNLGFEKGDYSGWTRYFGYYGQAYWKKDTTAANNKFLITKQSGPVDASADEISNSEAGWTERTSQITGTTIGDFQQLRRENRLQRKSGTKR